jgi:threonine/homoserine/homoserine lactone efflux protein
MVRALALGFVVGFPIAASPGPMIFLVLRRTLARGWRSGLISGLGVATGDAVYAGLAAFGVAAITAFLISERRGIGLVGGIAIALIGLRIVVKSESPHPDPPPQAGEEREPVLSSAYLSTLALTLGNPPTVLSFAAVFAGLGLRADAGWPPAVALVLGVMLGSTLWWVLLTGVVARLRRRMTPSITRGISVVAGVALIGFGLVAALSSSVRPG